MDNLNFSENIAKVCIEKFNGLPKSGKPKENQWTVLSCIVQEKNCKFDVVALGTGSKCIGSTKMSPKGDILNDSHAEVVCRRAFLLYLYDQIDLALKRELSIFISDSCKFQLDKTIKFHFFTTMMPCGDASIFPKCDNQNSGNLVEDKKKRCSDSAKSVCKKLKTDVGDIYRTGAKCLKDDDKQDQKKEGAQYHITGVVRTKPGRGDPTLSVSCSDKITKWCYLGLQGALLSVFLKEPVYLSTLNVIGNTPFSEESLQRTIYNRLGDLEMISPYTKSLIKFYQAKVTEFSFEKTDSKEVCASSIIWYKAFDNRKPEVATEGKKQGVTKKNMNLESSRLSICKMNLLRRFKLLHQRIHTNIDHLNYVECKEKALQYRTNWKSVKSRLGKWPEKSEALLKFY